MKIKKIVFLICIIIIPSFFTGFSYGQDISNDPELKELFDIIQNGSEKQRFVMLEDLLLTADSLHEFYILPYSCKLSFSTGHYDLAEIHAVRLLELSVYFKKNWNYGNAVHVACMILGRLAIRKNNINEAKKLLLAAGNTPGSTQLNDFGPNLSLANDLLKKGQYEVVIEYLELCRKFWRTAGTRIDKWISELRESQIPNFGGNLYY